MTALVAVIHAGLAAGWVGGMAYSLFVVQPKLQRFFGSDQDSREALTAVIASGNRWRVLGLVAVIAATGLALLWLVDTLWWIHAIKAMLLLMATGIFWFVSWRHWPRRIFATAAEGTALRPREPRCNASSECSYSTDIRLFWCYVLKLDVPTSADFPSIGPDRSIKARLRFSATSNPYGGGAV